MAEPVHRLTVAIPASLRPRLEKQAARERRSLNGQIIHVLEAALAVEELPASVDGAPVTALSQKA